MLSKEETQKELEVSFADEKKIDEGIRIVQEKNAGANKLIIANNEEIQRLIGLKNVNAGIIAAYKAVLKESEPKTGKKEEVKPA